MIKSKGSTTTAATELGWGPDLRSPFILGLLLVLMLQLLIALGLSLSTPGLAALEPQAPLIDLAPDQVTRIRITGRDDEEQVELLRKGEADWVVADLADLPVTASKVDQLLKQVTGLKRPLPVGTSEEARQRFKVADDAFVRRLTLEGPDGQGVTLILGETPGFRRLFGRPGGDDQVYDLPLALADLSNRADDWAQSGLLRLEEEQIAGISGADWSLTRTEDAWQLDDGTDPLDQNAARELASTLANLGYRGVLGVEDDPAYNQQSPVLELSIRLKDGSQRNYRISQAAGSEDYVLKDADRPYYFKLSKYDLEGLLDLDRAALSASPENPEEAAEAAERAPESTAPAGPAEPQTTAPEPAATSEPAETREPETATAPVESAAPASTQEAASPEAQQAPEPKPAPTPAPETAPESGSPPAPEPAPAQ